MFSSLRFACSSLHRCKHRTYFAFLLFQGELELVQMLLLDVLSRYRDKSTLRMATWIVRHTRAAPLCAETLRDCLKITDILRPLLACDFVREGHENPRSPQRGCSGFHGHLFLVSAQNRHAEPVSYFQTVPNSIPRSEPPPPIRL